MNGAANHNTPTSDPLWSVVTVLGDIARRIALGHPAASGPGRPHESLGSVVDKISPLTNQATRSVDPTDPGQLGSVARKEGR